MTTYMAQIQQLVLVANPKPVNVTQPLQAPKKDLVKEAKYNHSKLFASQKSTKQCHKASQANPPCHQPRR